MLLKLGENLTEMMVSLLLQVPGSDIRTTLKQLGQSEDNSSFS